MNEEQTYEFSRRKETSNVQCRLYTYKIEGRFLFRLIKFFFLFSMNELAGKQEKKQERKKNQMISQMWLSFLNE